jgi:4-amino-4-deoxy-L-arabinose transferase-like glycosyltransferase
MTATRTRQAPSSVAANPPAASRHALAIATVSVGMLTLVLRLAMHGRSFDLFGDEVIYAETGRSVVSGGFPRFYGEAFFLHGPGFFYLEAGWAHLFGNPPGLVALIYEMRMLNALLAAATAVVMVLLATRASSVRAGTVAGLLFALDPFCIRQNDRVLLETAMMLWVMLGYLAFGSLIGRPSSPRARSRAVGAGLLFGCAALTKDEAALLTVLPLLAAGALRWGPRRALIFLTVGATAVPYAVYVTVVAANGYFAGWWSAKTSGIKRLLGVVQTTGFHSSGGGSLSARLVAEGGYFVTTYVLLVLAVPALVVVLRRGGQSARMLGILHCAAMVTLGYAVTLGTLEEQELYLLIVPSLLTVPVAATLLHGAGWARRKPTRGRRHRGMLRAAVIGAALTVTFGLNLATGVQWLRQPDDGFAHLLSYMAAHVPARTAITAAAGTPPPSQTDGGRYALEGRYKVALWVRPAALHRERVRYILVEWGPIEEGYSYLTPSQVRKLIRHTRLVFSFRGRTYGQLALYKLPALSSPHRRH